MLDEGHERPHYWNYLVFLARQSWPLSGNRETGISSTLYVEDLDDDALLFFDLLIPIDNGGAPHLLERHAQYHATPYHHYYPWIRLHFTRRDNKSSSNSCHVDQQAISPSFEWKLSITDTIFSAPTVGNNMYSSLHATVTQTNERSISKPRKSRSPEARVISSMGTQISLLSSRSMHRLSVVCQRYSLRLTH
jgi:hypothetical protein